MTERTNKRKVAKAATAVGMAAVLLMGGTFAWQSISQEATNIVSAAVNPGGRLHDDFDGSNDKNIYVENFGTQNIYARIKLSEYLEIGQDAGNFAEDSNRENNLASGDIEVLLGEDIDTKATYTTYKYGETNTSDEYWTKDWDGSTKYIPTFNKDQDSLEADLNGTYGNTVDVDGDGTVEPYEDFVDYNAAAADYSETDIEWYDADTNDSAEAHVNPDSVTAGSHEIKENQTHTLADSLEGTVISMADWDGTPGAYWVYDTDGWAYWAQAIEPGTATGLLLDSITDLGLIDEDYYYAIHVTGQFITAGDLGDTDSTGFYQNAGEEPTDAALTLLETIGVKVGGDGEETPGVTEPEYSIAVLSRTVDNGYDEPYVEEYPGFMMSNDTWTFSLEENGAASDGTVTWSIAQVAGDGKLDGTDIDASTGVMTVAEGESMGSNGYESYDVFKITASDAEGNLLAERNILVCEFGIRREKLAFYENDVQVTGALEPGKTYDVRIATQECGTGTDVTDYLEPISFDNIHSVGVTQYNGSEDVGVDNVYYENGKFIVGEDASGYYTLSLSIGSSSGITQTIYVQSTAE